ncbi:hypothetical protein BKA80DRAFT_301552 [Phyllosticta citrichinensis]
MFPPVVKNMTRASAALYSTPTCSATTTSLAIQKDGESRPGQKWWLTVHSSLLNSVPTAVVSSPENKQIFPEFPLSTTTGTEGEKTQEPGPFASASRLPVSKAIGSPPAPEATSVDMATPGALNALSVLLSALSSVTVSYQTYYTESPTAVSGLATATTTVTVSEFPTSVVNSIISSALGSAPLSPLPASPSVSVAVNTAITSPTLTATQTPLVPESTSPLDDNSRRAAIDNSPNSAPDHLRTHHAANFTPLVADSSQHLRSANYAASNTDNDYASAYPVFNNTIANLVFPAANNSDNIVHVVHIFHHNQRQQQHQQQQLLNKPDELDNDDVFLLDNFVVIRIVIRSSNVHNVKKPERNARAARPRRWRRWPGIPFAAAVVRRSGCGGGSCQGVTIAMTPSEKEERKSGGISWQDSDVDFRPGGFVWIDRLAGR